MRSIDGHPGLLRQVEAVLHAVDRVPRLLGPRPLDLDVLLHHSGLSTEQGDGSANLDELSFGDEGIDDTGFISQDAAHVAAISTADHSCLDHLSYEGFTLAMNLMLSSPGPISLIFTIGLLSPLFSWNLPSVLCCWPLFPPSVLELFPRS